MSFHLAASWFTSYLSFLKEVVDLVGIYGLFVRDPEGVVPIHLYFTVVQEGKVLFLLWHFLDF